MWIFFEYSDDKEVVCVDEEKQSKGTVMKAKLLQFHENHRPAYYGTWRKSSRHITARKPLGQDKVTLPPSTTFIGASQFIPCNVKEFGIYKFWYP